MCSQSHQSILEMLGIEANRIMSPQKRRTEEVVKIKKGIYEIRTYSDDQIASLREKNDEPSQVFQRLKTFDHNKERSVYGYSFYIPVEKTHPNVYQDGTAVVEDELSFYHSTNEGLINSLSLIHI